MHKNSVFFKYKQKIVEVMSMTRQYITVPMESVQAQLQASNNTGFIYSYLIFC